MLNVEMKTILQKVFRHSELESKPPVLVDVGASCRRPAQWKLISPYSICVAFDADTRDFSVSESCGKDYKKLYSLNRLAAEKSANDVEFFLTRSPYCSSSLPPDITALKPWAFRHLFDVVKVVKMPAVDLTSALTEIAVDYIDWYKTDSQGTDLRIFRALPKDTIEKVIVADFEPGIIDAYVGEDKLHSIMTYMDKRPFWISHMQIKGSQRIDQEDLASLNALQRRSIDSFLKMAPGWCEISYLNKFEKDELGLREYLLGWVFSSIKGEHGFALHIAKTGGIKFQDSLFVDLSAFSRKLLSTGYIKFCANTIKRIASMALFEAK